MRKRATRAVAALLSAALILTSPGLGCYEAAAAQLGGRVARLPANGLNGALKTVASPELGAFFGLSAGLPSAALVNGTVLPSSVLAPAAQPAELSAVERSPAVGVSELVARAFAQLSSPGVSREAVHQAGLRLSGVDGRWNGGVSDAVVAGRGASRGLNLNAGGKSGSIKKASPARPVAAKTSSGLIAWGRKALRTVLLALALLLPAWSTIRAQPLTQPTQLQAPAGKSLDSLPVAGPVTAAVAIDKQGASVGERVRITLTLRNRALGPVTLSSLRAALQQALGPNLEIQGKAGDEPIVLAAGETKTATFEVVPFVSGDISLTGAVISVPAEGAVVGQTTNIILPQTVLQVKTVLTPDWREQGLRGVDDETLNGTTSDLDWLAAIPLALLLLVGVERMVAARRNYKKAGASQLPLLVRVEDRLSTLDDAIVADSRFYAELYGTLALFLVDYHGLPVRERDAARLRADLSASGKLASEQLAAAADLAARAEAVRFGTSTVEPQRRKDDLAALRRLIASVTGGTPQTGPVRSDGRGLRGLALLGVIPGATGLSFSHPWALLLLIPFVGWLVWKGLHRKSSAFTVPSSRTLPRAKSWRQRLANLPRTLRLAAIGLIIMALAGPQRGVERKTNYTPSTDTMIALDVSGSMDGSADALGTSKIDAAGKAVAAFIEEQRRGTENRVGLITFDDKTYIDMRLTTDYDALISHLKELRSGSSTAVGEAMLSAIGHFVEINILELNDANDPRFAKVRRVLLDEGLSAALEYAKNDRDLMDKIIRPDRQKVVVLFTDGMSNDGVDPMEAASIAAGLGVRIYTVGIQADEQGLKDIAAVTGGKYYRADDAARMRSVLLEISRLEKSPSQVLSTVSIKSYQGWLVALALLALGFEVLLGSTRLRSLSAALLLGAFVPLAELQQTAAPRPVATSQTQTASSWRLSDLLPLDQLPPEMAEGNKLYAEGRYDEALKAYGKAVALYPDVPELYFNMGNAYLRVGEPAKAQECWKKFAELTTDPKLASKATYNHGVAAVLLQDAKTALEDFREALRRDGGNADAKWNLEVLNKLLEEQRQQQQQQGQGQSGEKGEHGKPSDQQGQQQSEQGKPGDQKSKDAAEKLRQKLQEQEKEDKKDAPNGPESSGDASQWGVLAPPLAAVLGGAAFSFTSPAFLWALGLGVPLLLGLLAYGIVKRIKAAKKLSPATAPRSFRDWWGKRRFMRKAALVGAAVSLLSIAASGPNSGTHDERLNFGGKDILIAVDGSQSIVYAEDGRFDKTREELLAFIEKLRGTDRVGLVVFAGEARTASPVSIDYANFEYKVNRLDIEARGLEPGSHLSLAIEQAARSFKSVKKLDDRSQVLIVISDGDISSAEVDLAVDAAKRNGITVYTIGVGGPVGSRMKVPDGEGGTRYVTDDATGLPAVTHLNESTLKQIAAQTGGAYFHAGDGSSIESVLARVAELEKGHKEDAVRSPRPIGTYFLWPALLLLLLDLATPGASVLKKDEAPPKKKQDTSAPPPSKLGGIALMGLMPLSAWPQLLPFAVIFTVVAGFLLADVWTRGALGRGLRWAWGRRLKVVAKGLDADREALFDAREVDQERLAAFHQRWKAADEAGKRALAAEALEDAQLWRQKLALALLAGATPETEESIAAAIRTGAKRYLESMDPVAARVAGLRAKLPWLQHVDAAARLSRLAALGLDSSKPESRALLTELAAFPDIRVSLPAQEVLGAPPAARRSWTRRIALVFAGLGLAGAVFLTGLAGVQTARYSERQTEAAEQSAKVFFGADAFIFEDNYVDDRIPQYVLPALRDWSRDDALGRQNMDRAISVILSSPDPKVNNLIEVVFKHADYLALTQESERALLKAIVESEDARLWGVVEGELDKTAFSPRAAERYATMVELGVASYKTAVYANLWRILKSPNEQLRAFTYSKLYERFADPRLGFNQPLKLLASVQQAYPTDPAIALWVEKALLQRISAADGSQFKFSTLRSVLARSLIVAYQADLQRPQALAQGIALPPSFIEQAVGVIVSAEETAKARGEMPPPLTETVKYAVHLLTNTLIGEGEQHFPGLHQKLVDKEVVLPDESSSRDVMNMGFRSEEDGTRFHDAYRLRHLEDLRAAVREEGAAAPDSLISKKEYAARADSVLTKLIDAGEKAGIVRDLTVAHRAAEAVEIALDDAISFFTEEELLAILTPAGLAKGPDGEGSIILKDAYSREELVKLSDVLEASALKDGSWTWDEKLQLVKAAANVDELARKFYPQTGERVALAEKDFFRRLDTPGEEGLILARAALESMKRSEDGAFQLRLYAHVLKRAAGPQGKLMKGEEFSEYLTQALTLTGETRQDVKAWSLLAESLKGQPADGVLAATSRGLSQMAAAVLIYSAENRFPSFDTAAKREHLERRDYKVSVMKRALAVFEETAGKQDPKSLSAAQKETLKSFRTMMPLVITIAERSGVPPVETAGERVAAAVNDALKRANSEFAGYGILVELQMHGLAQPVSQRGTVDEAYFPSYTRRQLVDMRVLFQKIVDRHSITLDPYGVPWALDRDEWSALQDLIVELDAQIGAYPAPGTLYGFAPLGLLLAAPVSLTTLLAVGAVLAGLWFVWRWLMGAPREAPLQARSLGALERYRKLGFAARKLASSAGGGGFRSLFIGRNGAEFAETKLFEDEEFREIDWKTTAKTGELHAQRFEEEKDMPLMLLVDMSRSSDFGASGLDKRTVIAETAAVLALAASLKNLRVGAVFFTDKIERYVAPRSGRRNAQELMKELLDFEPSGSGTDLNGPIDRVLGQLKSRAMVAVISDFLAPEFAAKLAALARKHDVRAIQVSDPVELKPLPDVGLLRVRDAETGEERLVDTANAAFRAQQAGLVARRRTQLQEAFDKARLKPVLLSTDGDHLQTLYREFQTKKHAKGA